MALWPVKQGVSHIAEVNTRLRYDVEFLYGILGIRLTKM